MNFSLRFLIFSLAISQKSLENLPEIPRNSQKSPQSLSFFLSISQKFPTFLIFSLRFSRNFPPKPSIFPSFSNIRLKNFKIFLEQYQYFTKNFQKNFSKNLVSIIKGSNFATPNQMILNARAGEHLSREGR